MICVSVETSFEDINKFKDYADIEVFAYGRVELMNMKHCPYSLIKGCQLKGCESCKFKSGHMKNNDGISLLTIRDKGITKIYPKQSKKIDIDKLDDNVSILIQAIDDSDIKTYKTSNKLDNINYDRGVL